jgi:hypothetical protein
MYLNIDNDFRSPNESITFSSSINAGMIYRKNTTNISIGVYSVHSRSLGSVLSASLKLDKIGIPCSFGFSCSRFAETCSRFVETTENLNVIS